MSAPEVSQVTTPTRFDHIMSVIESIVADLIGVDAAHLDSQATFLEMGADSLSLLQASQAIQDKLGVRIPFRLLFEELSTMEALAAHIDAELGPEPPPAPAIKAVAPLSQEPPKPWPQPAAQPRPPVTSIETWATEPEVAYRPSAEESQGDAPGSAVERILASQLQLMSRQLDLLRNGSGGRQETLLAEPHATPEVAAFPAAGPKSELRVAPVSAERAECEVIAASAPEAANKIIDPEPYVAYKPIEKKATPGGLTPRQREHLDALIERLNRRTAGSKRMTEQQRKRLADSSASAGFRSLWKEICYPIAVERARGSRVWDVDGNEYVDITMGFGSLFFGHSPDFIIESVEEQLSRGLQIGWKTEVAGKVAELLCEMTGTERAAFCNSGTEAVMSALRLARAVTGRTRIAVFAGSFHGTFDGVLIKGEKNPDGTLRAVPMAPGVPRHMVEQVLVLTHGDPQSLEILKQNIHELAAVLVEPCPSRRPDLQTKEFLQALRELTTEGGAALIFDEVIIGFRMHPGGAQALFDVKADIVTYGKALGSGVPIGAIAGKAAFLDAVDGGVWSYGDSSFPSAETTYYAGTFFKHPVIMSAAYAALKRMKESGPELQRRLGERTAEFAEGVNEFFRQEGLPIQVGHFGSLFRFFYPKELRYMDLFFFHLIEKGVWVSETRVCFVSTSTTDEDLAYVTNAIKESVAELQRGGFLPSNSPGDGDRPPRRSDTEDGPHTGASPVRVVPTTEAQKGLWVLAQMGGATSGAYNESMLVRLRGPLDVGAMAGAVQKVINRHEALRTTFSEDGDYQKVAPEISVEVPLVDFRDGDAGSQKRRLSAWLEDQIREPFDMLEGPLVRARVARLEDQEHLLVLVIHHIVTDAWSFDRLLGEINTLYSAARDGVARELPRPVPYSDYVRFLSDQKTSEQAQESERYWMSRFGGLIPTLELPTDRPRPALQTYNGARLRRKIDPALCRELKAFSGRRGCTLFMSLLSGFKALLHHLTGQDDIVVGTHSAGQANAGGADLIGFCINMLPLRSQLVGDPAFDDYMRSVKRNVLDAYQHQDYPVSRLIKKLKLRRDPSRPPLVSVVFNMDWAMSVDRVTSGLEDAGLRMELVEGPIVFSRFDLLWNLVDVGGEIVLDCTFNTDLFDPETIAGWMRDYEALLGAVVSQPDIKIAALGEVLDESGSRKRADEYEELKAQHLQKFKVVKRKAKCPA